MADQETLLERLIPGDLEHQIPAAIQKALPGGFRNRLLQLGLGAAEFGLALLPPFRLGLLGLEGLLGGGAELLLQLRAHTRLGRKPMRELRVGLADGSFGLRASLERRIQISL